MRPLARSFVVVALAVASTAALPARAQADAPASLAGSPGPPAHPPASLPDAAEPPAEPPASLPESEPASTPVVTSLPATVPASPPQEADLRKDLGSWTPALFGDPTALSRRPPTNRMFTLELALKYGLVGSGPTKFINDIRFSLLDWLELRTQVGPVVLPESLVARVSVGPWRRLGRVGLEAGFHKLDLGFRIFPEEGEARGLDPAIVPSVNALGAVTYDVPVWDRFSIHASARVQQRLQHSVRKLIQRDLRDPFSQLAGQLALQGTWDISQFLALTGGLGAGGAVDNRVLSDGVKRLLHGQVPWEDDAVPRVDVDRAIRRRDPSTIIDTRHQCGEEKTKTLFVDFVEMGRPGYGTLVDREMNCHVGLMGALTYGRTESFDVDIFSAVRLWPRLGWLLGGGVRWRIAP